MKNQPCFEFWREGALRAALSTISRAVRFAFLIALLVLAARPLRAQSETVLYSFVGGSDGAKPYAGLVRDRNGNLYGTTTAGGGSSSCFGNCGTVFKVSRSGSETVLYSFTGPEGATPYGGLVQDATGNLYGTTTSGTSYIGPVSFLGTVFEVTATGAETVLHTFTGPAQGDGSFPYASLMRDEKGNLYGPPIQAAPRAVRAAASAQCFR
jgi:uncharacterized repeat protein (TIGR03803 family)